MSDSGNDSDPKPPEPAAEDPAPPADSAAPVTPAPNGYGPVEDPCSEEALRRQIAELQRGIQARQAVPGAANAPGVLVQISITQSRLKELVDTVTTLEGERTALTAQVERMNAIADESAAGFEATQQTYDIEHNALVEEVNQLRAAVQREIQARQELEPQLNEVLQLIENQAQIHETLQNENQALQEQINESSIRSVTPERHALTINTTDGFTPPRTNREVQLLNETPYIPSQQSFPDVADFQAFQEAFLRDIEGTADNIQRRAYARFMLYNLVDSPARNMEQCPAVPYTDARIEYQHSLVPDGDAFNMLPWAPIGALQNARQVGIHIHNMTPSDQAAYLAQYTQQVDQGPSSPLNYSVPLREGYTPEGPAPQSCSQYVPPPTQPEFEEWGNSDIINADSAQFDASAAAFKTQSFGNGGGVAFDDLLNSGGGFGATFNAGSPGGFGATFDGPPGGGFGLSFNNGLSAGGFGSPPFNNLPPGGFSNSPFNNGPPADGFGFGNSPQGGFGSSPFNNLPAGGFSNSPFNNGPPADGFGFNNSPQGGGFGSSPFNNLPACGFSNSPFNNGPPAGGFGSSPFNNLPAGGFSNSPFNNGPPADGFGCNNSPQGGGLGSSPFNLPAGGFSNSPFNNGPPAGGFGSSPFNNGTPAGGFGSSPFNNGSPAGGFGSSPFNNLPAGGFSGSPFNNGPPAGGFGFNNSPQGGGFGSSPFNNAQPTDGFGCNNSPQGSGFGSSPLNNGSGQNPDPRLVNSFTNYPLSNNPIDPPPNQGSPTPPPAQPAASQPPSPQPSEGGGAAGGKVGDNSSNSPANPIATEAPVPPSPPAGSLNSGPNGSCGTPNGIGGTPTGNPYNFTPNAGGVNSFPPAVPSGSCPPGSPRPSPQPTCSQSAYGPQANQNDDSILEMVDAMIQNGDLPSFNNSNSLTLNTAFNRVEGRMQVVPPNYGYTEVRYPTSPPPPSPTRVLHPPVYYPDGTRVPMWVNNNPAVQPFVPDPPPSPATAAANAAREKAETVAWCNQQTNGEYDEWVRPRPPPPPRPEDSFSSPLHNALVEVGTNESHYREFNQFQNGALTMPVWKQRAMLTPAEAEAQHAAQVQQDFRDFNSGAHVYRPMGYVQDEYERRAQWARDVAEHDRVRAEMEAVPLEQRDDIWENLYNNYYRGPFCPYQARPHFPPPPPPARPPTPSRFSPPPRPFGPVDQPAFIRSQIIQGNNPNINVDQYLANNSLNMSPGAGGISSQSMPSMNNSRNSPPFSPRVAGPSNQYQCANPAQQMATSDSAPPSPAGVVEVALPEAAEEPALAPVATSPPAPAPEAGSSPSSASCAPSPRSFGPIPVNSYSGSTGFSSGMTCSPGTAPPGVNRTPPPNTLQQLEAEAQRPLFTGPGWSCQSAWPGTGQDQWNSQPYGAGSPVVAQAPGSPVPSNYSVNPPGGFTPPGPRTPQQSPNSSLGMSSWDFGELSDWDVIPSPRPTPPLQRPYPQFMISPGSVPQPGYRGVYGEDYAAGEQGGMYDARPPTPPYQPFTPPPQRPYNRPPPKDRCVVQ